MLADSEGLHKSLHICLKKRHTLIDAGSRNSYLQKLQYHARLRFAIHNVFVDALKLHHTQDVVTRLSTAMSCTVSVAGQAEN